MSLRLYNTLSRSKEEFVPLDPKNVRMYVCGPTVYDYAHIGNARPAVVFDVLFRLLRHIYGEQHVTYVRNVTDIDDKINARALERRGDRNVPILDVVRELTEETYGVYQKDVEALGNLRPTFMPRATENIAPMIAMIEALIAARHAYPAEGHVLFDVLSKPNYGKLSRRPLDEMIAGARVDVAPYKKNPMDFVLWKPSDANTPGWNSRWGRGRPGWHLECSAMIESTFKSDTIDIHGGGIDLVFPHHENEIAQSEGAHHDHPLARYWMHNGFLNVEGEKMSKSLGNFVTIRQALGDDPGDVLRFNMLKTHYRQPMDWAKRNLIESFNTFAGWVRLLNMNLPDWRGLKPVFAQDFLAALSDDLNTPLGIAELHRLTAEKKYEELAASLLALGFKGDIRENWLEENRINKQIEDRNEARKARNFKESDRIRDELWAQGIALKDNPDGTTSWEVKR